MTLYHYIAANKELPLGSFGLNPTYKPISELNPNMSNYVQLKGEKYQKGDQLIEVYETEEDFNGIYIDKPDPHYEAAVRDKLTHPYIYQLEIILSLRPLFLFIEKHLSKGDTIEIYSCLNDEESKEKDDRLDTEIDLAQMRFGKHIYFKKIDELIHMFDLEDKQYVLVKK
ncbi:hypothetical protein QUF51_01275 [Bacillus pumilus]|nr:hypothetical protein [Bacillus pumilus]OLP65781.1 hypothetical protein BACPU_13990 [Bacillus pumilus]